MIQNINSKKDITNFKLKALQNITNAIIENLNKEELLKRYESLLTQDLGIGKVLVFKYENSWKVILKSGNINENSINIDVEKDLLHLKDITTTVTIPNKKIFEGFDIIIPVIHKSQPIAYVLIGDIEEGDGISPTIRHLTFIQTLSNIIIVAIENIRLFQELLRQEAVKKELELAKKMQLMLIPDVNELPKNERIHVTAFYHPNFEVGGDYYDFIELNNDEIGFCISDVSGKGISAALLMSNFQANLRALFTYDINLVALVEKLNRRVIKATKGEKFITLFIAKFNFKTRELEYINAGHNPPLLYFKKKKELLKLDKGCVGLGMLEEIPTIRKGSITIEEPAKILCYTDGLTDFISEKGITSESDFLEKSINNKLPIEKNIQKIIKKQKIFNDNMSFFDDITILGIEIF